MTQCFIVVGPESSGNRYVVRLLVAAGCDGHGSTEQPLVDCGPTWRVSIKSSSQPLAFVRSFPHGDSPDDWPNLATLIGVARQAGFEPAVLVCIRNQYSTQQSQLRAGHAATEAEASAAIQLAHESIMAGIVTSGAKWLHVCYEALRLPGYRCWLMRTLGLNESAVFETFVNGNDRYS